MKAYLGVLIGVIALSSTACGGEAMTRADADADAGGAQRGSSSLGAAPTTPPTDGWATIARSPLPGRHDAAGVWTGTEMIVAGGTTSPPCPPGADCVGDVDGAERADGAAYDPESDTWRAIAEAPRTFTSTQAVWSGEEMVVLTASRTLAYDPVSDTWRALAPPPELLVDPAPPVVADEVIVFGSYDQVPNREATDLVLDPATGVWTPLPRDPFGESYDRSLAWDGTRLWLLSMPVEGHFEAYDGSPSRLAVLEGGPAAGTWRVVDPQTPDLGQGQVLWSVDDRLVVPTGAYGGTAAYTFDTRDEEWTRVEASPGRDACAVPRVGPGPAWIADGRELTAPTGEATMPVPGCPSLPDADVAVWAGDELLLWGGPDRRYDTNSAGGLVWSPAS